MTLRFEDEADARDELDRLLGLPVTELPERLVAVEPDEIFSQFHTATQVLLERANWTKTIGITNKHAEYERFQEAGSPAAFEPEFTFKRPDWEHESFLAVLDAVIAATDEISDAALQPYHPATLDASDFRDLFRDTFRELALYVELAATIENDAAWRTHSATIWPMVEESTIDEIRSRLQLGFQEPDGSGELDAHDLKSMWVEELERLGVEWSVEVRDVPGCFNIPEERTVVAAAGSEVPLTYSVEKARLLTMHELFHVVRAYNGITASEHSGFPPIIGVHTPFYDMTEEGGALYREDVTDTAMPSQTEDYHIRALAAYELSQGASFGETVQRLMALGASEQRAFMLTARNREGIRHHIYQGGYLQEWKHRDDVAPLLLGKLNTPYAERFWAEVEAGGMFGEPAVDAEILFSAPDWRA